MKKSRKEQILDLFKKNEQKINDFLKQKQNKNFVDLKNYKVLLGKKLSLLSSLLSEMDSKDPFRIVVETLQKEVEEKFYQKG